MRSAKLFMVFPDTMGAKPKGSPANRSFVEDFISNCEPFPTGEAQGTISNKRVRGSASELGDTSDRGNTVFFQAARWQPHFE